MGASRLTTVGEIGVTHVGGLDSKSQARYGRDPVFGPVLMFGLGGIHVEVLRDVSLRVLPITRDDARAMVRELRAFAILNGARGQAPVDLESIVDTLCALADFALRAGDTLVSAEINPLIARAAADGGAIAVDALVIGRTEAAAL